MSWFYIPSSCVPDTEGSRSPSKLPASRLARSATWRGKHSRRQSWLTRWSKVSWMRLLSGLTLRRSTADRGAARWISSLPDSRASLGAQPASDSASQTSGITESGRTSQGSPESVGPGSSSSKTSRWTLFEDQELTWKIWATESRRQSESVRQMLARRTEGIGGGVLLPTPRASTGGPDTQSRKTGKNLAAAVKMWPTPRAQEPSRTSVGYGRGLAELIEGKKQIGNQSYWTTPTSDDTCHRKKKYQQGGTDLSAQAGGALNPTWVEWLMGLPIGWTDLGCSETGLSQWLEQSHFDI